MNTQENLHTQVENLAIRMAKRLDMSLETLLLLAKHHDIGKSKISKDILFKNGPLTDKEWQEMKRHPQIGYKIAQNIPKLNHIAKGILHHHERWDGMVTHVALKKKRFQQTDLIKKPKAKKQH